MKNKKERKVKHSNILLVPVLNKPEVNTPSPDSVDLYDPVFGLFGSNKIYFG